MSSKEIQPLAQASDEQVQEWLRNGILGMSGLRDGGKHAFEPYASHIGRAREFTWLDELSKFAISLDPESKVRFDRAVNETLQFLSQENLSANWIALLHLLDLMRNTSTRQRFKGLESISTRLAHDDNATDAGIRRRLATTALLAATDAEGSDRMLVRPTAIQLAKLVLSFNSKDDLKLREGIRARLLRIGIEAAQVENLGLVEDDDRPLKCSTLRALLSGGAQQRLHMKKRAVEE